VIFSSLQRFILKHGSRAQPAPMITSGLALISILSALSISAVGAEPEMQATARSLPGLASAGIRGGRIAASADQNNFALGTDQSKFNLGTSAKQSTAPSSVGLKVSRDNPAIMTIVGHNEADIEKLLAKRYHRVVIPIVPYRAPEGPMQQTIKGQEIKAQSINQQSIAQQTVIAQPPQSWQLSSISAMPMETVNRFINILNPANKGNGGDLSAQAKPLKPFGQATYINWDPWYKRIKATADSRWRAYNNQLNTEVTAHITVYPGNRLAVSGVDVNLWKSARPFDSSFNDASKQAALEVMNSIKGSPILRFPANTRRAEVSFDLIFATGGRAGVGISVPINDVETVYGI